ncbi:MAG: recombinase family protein [Desulfovermiculus sp.]|nr:recombinase family protein [Desulfovermiculus sp.]
MHLDALIDILNKNKVQQPFACINDLVANGLVLERFADPDVQIPNRQDVTMFLAAWCKSVGLSQEDYQQWLIDYSLDVLSKISSSSLSQIRHSTKSVVKYIQNSDVHFTCDVEYNIFKAKCTQSCPVYTEMEQIYFQRLEDEKKIQKELEEKNQPPEVDPERLPITKRNKPQYEEAVREIEKYLEQGYTKQKISELLNKDGYTTITGKKWAANSVSRIAIMKGWAPKRNRRQS